MESTLKNMILTLLIICFTASAAVGVIYRMTEGQIAKAKIAKTSAAIGAVLPDFDNNPDEDKQVVDRDGGQLTVYTAKQGEDVIGYAIETFTNKGFGGPISLMVGFLPDGTIYKIETLKHSETPGLGDKIERKKNPQFSAQFEGKNPESFKLKVTKDGGDIDAITASTISSRAYADAVERAYEVLKSISK